MAKGLPTSPWSGRAGGGRARTPLPRFGPWRVLPPAGTGCQRQRAWSDWRGLLYGVLIWQRAAAMAIACLRRGVTEDAEALLPWTGDEDIDGASPAPPSAP